MLKRILFLSIALSLFLAVPLQATARVWINLPEKQGAEGDPEDGNHSPSIDVIKPPAIIVVPVVSTGVYGFLFILVDSQDTRHAISVEPVHHVVATDSKRVDN